jgi:hypothetical protein
MDLHRHHEDHHAVRDTLNTAGEVFRDALLSIVGEPHPEPWEETLERYEHDHPELPAPRSQG